MNPAFGEVSRERNRCIEIRLLPPDITKIGGIVSNGLERSSTGKLLSSAETVDGLASVWHAGVRLAKVAKIILENHQSELAPHDAMYEDNESSKRLKENVSLVTTLLRDGSVDSSVVQVAKQIGYEIRDFEEKSMPKNYRSSIEDEKLVSGVHIRRMLGVDAENTDANHQSRVLRVLITNSGKLPLGISCFVKPESTHESMMLTDKFCPLLVFEDIRLPSIKKYLIADFVSNLIARNVLIGAHIADGFQACSFGAIKLMASKYFEALAKVGILTAIDQNDVSKTKDFPEGLVQVIQIIYPELSNKS